jgi:hypothetical protein
VGCGEKGREKKGGKEEENVKNRPRYANANCQASAAFLTLGLSAQDPKFN